ncbi:MAG: tetratricopeptide repeat protein [Paracoccaceae bacterium]
MIELGTSSDASTASGGGVMDTTDATFVKDVIETSRETPVVVDFWAPWCGPCKTLGPMLEQEVAATNGKVRMVKVDVDKNQMIAAQLRVQSIPAVFGFVDGQPVDAFMGAVSPAEGKDFVQRLAKGAGAGALDEALDAAEEMLEQGALAEAAQTFAAILGEDPENPRAMGGMIRATVAAGDIERARTMLEQVPASITEDPAIAAARGAVELATQAEDAGETADLRAAIDADPNNHRARFDLSVALAASGDNENAIEELLELFRRDREWNDSAAKEQLMTLFDTLGPKDPLALKGRRRLSSMIFA